MNELRSVILAAGKGTRMKSELPKVLHKVVGKPMLQYVLDVVQYVGSLKNYVILGSKAEQVQKHLGNQALGVLQKKQQGTADAVRSASDVLKNFKGDVLVLCGDTPLLNKKVIKKLVRKHQSKDVACTMLTAHVEDPTDYGRILRNGKDIVAIREQKDLTSDQELIDEINVGVYCFRNKDLQDGLKKIKLNSKKKEYYLTDIIEIFSSQNLKIESVQVEDFEEGLGVNSRQDLAVAEAVIRDQILNKWMDAGVTIEDPSTTYIGHDVKIGSDTILKAFTYIENNVTIGSNCVIGPFAHLRPGTKLSPNVQVGNFAEVSRTSIGAGSLVKHCSYLGDSKIGSDVNIGAGTVIANYDGKEKNITKISDGAFIGSNSVLISPVQVGKQALVGAGSSVKKGTKVPARKIVVGNPARQIEKERDF